MKDISINHINELDQAGLKVDMKNMYKQVGIQGSMQCLYELMLASEILLNVIKEAQKHESL